MGFLHEHIILPLSDIVKGEQVHKYLRLLREAERWTPEQMKDFQQEKLRELIVYASNEVPFYRDWFRDHNLDPQTASLEQLPIVSKSIMRQEGIKRFTAEHFPIKQRISSRSSGPQENLSPCTRVNCPTPLTPQQNSAHGIKRAIVSETAT